MGTRLELHALLVTTLGTSNVYFQPPPNFLLNYPCIVYHRSNIRSKSANDAPYKLDKEYTVTVITNDPDSDIPDKVAKLSRCVFDRAFKTAGLNHDIYTILF